MRNAQEASSNLNTTQTELATVKSELDLKTKEISELTQEKTVIFTQNKENELKQTTDKHAEFVEQA